MLATIRLFKALPIDRKVKGKAASSKLLLETTIKRGFVFSPEVVANYSEKYLLELANTIGLSGEEMNSSFHKSWAKIAEADIKQLVLEQHVHYITTYGFESLGVYDENSVYVPNEHLNVPGVTEDLRLLVIKGYTRSELREKLLNLLRSGVALGETTIKDILKVVHYCGKFSDKEVESIKNKEVKAVLYEKFAMVPKNAVEFLRYVIYRTTEKTLLIKDAATFNEIKDKSNQTSLDLFRQYENKNGLPKLAEIFFRFKPLFLAFRANRELRPIINKIRKLADCYHKPLPEDYLNGVTAKLKNGGLSREKLLHELDQVNIFRKIRLAHALNYRTDRKASSILYKVRNGKAFADSFDFRNKKGAQDTLEVVLDSIVEDISNKVNGKRIYIPENITYSLPATEKQFTGVLPSGTCVTTPKDMIVGVHWKNVGRSRVDLDLSLIGFGVKYGWDADYRNDDRSIMFSGDLTDAPGQKGASELYYVKKQTPETFLVCLNYYNYGYDSYYSDNDGGIEVPFQLFVAQQKIKHSIKLNFMVNPNKVIVKAESKIDKQQKVLGLLVVTEKECKFYFTETNLGNTITSGQTEYAEHSRNYLETYYRNSITLNSLLEKAGAEMVSENECDINLSPEALEKDSILNLIN